MESADPWREAWHAAVAEAVLEPARPIVDPHHHLWPEARPAPYLLPELWRDTGSGHKVEQTVFVECMAAYRTTGPEPLKPVGETEFVADAAMQSAAAGPSRARIAAIVGFADLLLGERVTPVLEAHLAAGQGLFRGIRHAAGIDPSPEIRRSHTNPPPGLYGDTAFRAGFSRLAPLGLSFDAWNYHPQIGELTALARAFPETAIILDHFGGPLGIGPYEGRREEVFANWRRAIDGLASCPNVSVKIGGLAMPINGFNFHKQDRPATARALVDAQRAYYMHTIEAFGPARCMFESNFPVDRASIGYRALWNAFKLMAEPYSASEKDDLFRGTASRAYRLKPVA